MGRGGALNASPVPGAPAGPRNIVLCFDGTGDWAASDDTNVAKIFSALERDSQLCYYDGGVGTLNDPAALTAFKRTALRLLDLAIATGLRDKVMQGYSFLVQNYRPGDKIYLFGFSRGSFTARVLAGMIHNFGLLRPEAAHLAPYLWQSTSFISEIATFKIGANRVRRDFCRPERIEIEFMGLFDTVTSVGIVSRFNVYPNTDRNASVKRTCHAVSIEEERNAFPDSLIHPNQPNLTEVWFPGVHRDAGGGVLPIQSRVSDEALHWIQTEAVAAGLDFARRDTPDPNVVPAGNYGSSDPYVLIGLYPLKIFTKRVSGYRFFWPNLFHIRIVPEGAFVHEIAELYYGKGPRPANFPSRYISFKTGDRALSSGPYTVPAIPPNPADFAGTTVGIAGLLLLWNSLAGSPLGASWPHGIGWWALGLLVFYFYSQSIGQSVTRRWPKAFRPRSGPVVPLIGALVIGGLWARNPDWVLAPSGVVAGVAVWAVAQIGPLPVVRADRVLPYFLFAGAFWCALVRVFQPVTSQVAALTPYASWIFSGLLALLSVGAAVKLVHERRCMKVDATSEVGKPKA